MASSARIWDRFADRYEKAKVKDEETYLAKLKKTQEFLAPEMEVLEFGCGTGTTALHHSPHVKHILATDISAKMLGHGERKAKEQGITNVTFKQTAIEDLNAEGKVFDAILALNILHLLEDRETVIKHMYDLLKPGGVFISSTPALNDTLPWLKFILPIGQLFGRIPYVTFFKKAELRQSFVDRGFEMEHEWNTNKNGVLFAVARKPDQ